MSPVQLPAKWTFWPVWAGILTSTEWSTLHTGLAVLTECSGHFRRNGMGLTNIGTPMDHMNDNSILLEVLFYGMEIWP